MSGATSQWRCFITKESCRIIARDGRSRGWARLFGRLSESRSKRARGRCVEVVKAERDVQLMITRTGRSRGSPSCRARSGRFCTSTRVSSIVVLVCCRAPADASQITSPSVPLPTSSMHTCTPHTAPRSGPTYRRITLTTRSGVSSATRVTSPTGRSSPVRSSSTKPATAGSTSRRSGSLVV
jgi:hypothetical protein